MKKEIEVEVKPDIKVIGEPSYCLQPGYAFRYKGKEWNPEIITDEAIETSKVIGKQNIHDVDCIVFKDADGNKWAQAIQTCRGTMRKAKEPKKSCASEPKRKPGRPRKASEPARHTSNKLVRFPEGVMTEKEWVERYADRVEEAKCSWLDFFDRTKFNRMDNDEQKKYEAQLKKKAEKPDYRAYKGDIFYTISKETYLWAKKEKNISEPKRKPGRPRKIKEPIAEPKRKPGRPRKISEPGPLPPMKLGPCPSKECRSSDGCPPDGCPPVSCDVGCDGKKKKAARVEEPREVSFKTKKGVKTFTADKEKAAQRKKEKRAMRYNPIRAAIEKDYQISRGGMIKSPGKFEGEMIYMPYFFGVFMEGGADGEDERGRITVSVSKEDKLIFPELGKTRKHVIFKVDDYGFVNELFRR